MPKDRKQEDVFTGRVRSSSEAWQLTKTYLWVNDRDVQLFGFYWRVVLQVP